MNTQTYTLPPLWESAIGGWTRWMTAAGASPETIRVRRGIVRATARRAGTPGPAAVTTDLLIGLCAVTGWSADHRRNVRGALLRRVPVQRADRRTYLPRPRRGAAVPVDAGGLVDAQTAAPLRHPRLCGYREPAGGAGGVGPRIGGDDPEVHGGVLGAGPRRHRSGGRRMNEGMEPNQ